MKTYPAKIFKEALLEIIDTEKYVKFSYFQDWAETLKIYPFLKKDKLRYEPNYVKGKIVWFWCRPEGLVIVMDHCWMGYSKGNKKYYGTKRMEFEVKNIRWENNPFDMNKVEEKCRQLIKKLPEFIREEY